MRNVYLIFLLSLWCGWTGLSAQTPAVSPILAGIESTQLYLPQLYGKRIAIFCNHTSTFSNGVHLVDSLIHLGMDIRTIYAPEHGFRGDKDAGEHIDNGKDEKTHINIVSMYGSKKELDAKDVQDIDVVIFDIQDVGVRFYTYISSLEYIIRSCMQLGKTLLVFDRPNPHVSYVDGPVLDTAFRSFVGMQPVPVVYGMTIGEYARMLVGEGWIMPKSNVSAGFQMEVIPCEAYSRDMNYELPIAPSPNLTSKNAILLYPSLCFFEGTVVSVGRGTATPFEVYGHPSFDSLTFPFIFTPKQTKGNKSPLYLNVPTKGEKIEWDEEYENKINLTWLLKSYQHYPDPSSFFIFNVKDSAYFFDKLAGTDILRLQIAKGWSEEKIKHSWQQDIREFKRIRRKYLLYPQTKEPYK